MLGDSDSLMKIPNIRLKALYIIFLGKVRNIERPLIKSEDAESFLMRGGGGSPFPSSVRTELGQDLNGKFWIKVYQYVYKWKGKWAWKCKFQCFIIKKVSKHDVM